MLKKSVYSYEMQKTLLAGSCGVSCSVQYLPTYCSSAAAETCSHCTECVPEHFWCEQTKCRRLPKQKRLHLRCVSVTSAAFCAIVSKSDCAIRDRSCGHASPYYPLAFIKNDTVHVHTGCFKASCITCNAVWTGSRFPSPSLIPLTSC